MCRVNVACRVNLLLAHLVNGITGSRNYEKDNILDTPAIHIRLSSDIFFEHPFQSF